MVEDDTPPPRPTSLDRLDDEIEIATSSPKARKRCVVATVNDLKSQHAIEVDGTRHVVGGQRDGTDALDHRENAPSKVCHHIPAHGGFLAAPHQPQARFTNARAYLRSASSGSTSRAIQRI